MGFSVTAYQNPRGKSIVICLLLTHLPGKLQVSLPRSPCPSPRCLLSSAWLPASPWCPKVALRSPHTPVLSIPCFQISGHTGKLQADRGGHLKVRSWGSGLGQKISLLICFDSNEPFPPTPTLHPQRQPELCLVNEIQRKGSRVGAAGEHWKEGERKVGSSFPKS